MPTGRPQAVSIAMGVSRVTAEIPASKTSSARTKMLILNHSHLGSILSVDAYQDCITYEIRKQNLARRHRIDKRILRKY
uniref:Uncharacterized protein n=1 Tax=Romanomermis culicivorax TaxID=13658 RepID=A0A915I9E5_ROMCU